MEKMRYVKVANNLFTLPEHIPEWMKDDTMRGKSLQQEALFWKDVQTIMQTSRIEPLSNVSYTLLQELIIMNRFTISQNAKIELLSQRVSKLEDTVLALRGRGSVINRKKKDV